MAKRQARVAQVAPPTTDCPTWTIALKRGSNDGLRESTAKSCDYKTRFPLKETPRPQTRLKTRFRFSSPVEARRGAQMKTKSKRNRKSSRTELNAKHATRKIEREGERRRTSKRERERGRPREADVSQSKFLASLRMLSFWRLQVSVVILVAERAVRFSG